MLMKIATPVIVRRFNELRTSLWQTFASSFLKKKKKNSFIIDGDRVRETLSKDLNYDLKNRIIQINRLYNVAILVLDNGYFPIISRDLRYHSASRNVCLITAITPSKEFGYPLSDHPPVLNSTT